MLGLHQEETRVEQTVSFNEDGVVATFDVPSVSPAQDYLLSTNDGLTNDIKGFLSRPVTVGNIVWNETDNLGDDIFNPVPDAPQNSGYDLPDTWLDVPMIAEKVRGFSFLRCSFKVRLQFNAQPFNAGRVILYFYPFANNFSTDVNAVIASTCHFGGVTGYRHVDLDLSTATSAELTIPYIGLISHHNLIHSKSSMGRVRCIVYSKLTSGATEAQTTVDGTVWVHAEDIDLQMPTGVGQLTTPSRRVTAQVNSKEKVQPAKGTIETLANATSSVCEQVGRIPGLSEMANGVRWVSDFVGGFAGIFGWSRPTDPSFATIVQPSYVRHMTNFNGDTKSKPMGLDARNEIETPMGSFTTTDDEMALASVLSRPVFIDRFSMSQSQVAKTNLWRWPVVPSACTKSATADPYPVGVMYHHTFLSYLSRLFTFWRGTLNYHFKIVKTSFHSGRIRVFFVPLADLTTDIAHIDFDKCYNKIYDIRDLAEFDFAIPYVSNTVWRNLGATSNTLDVSYDTPSGMIYVQVLNQLRNPSVASDTIEFLVESSAGEDFQFAFLTQSSAVKPLRIVHENFLSFVSSDDDREYTRRVGAQCDDFFETHKMKDYNPNVLGIGEAITSLRQVLKRYGRYPTALPAVSGTNKLNILRPYDTNDCFHHTVSSNQSGPLDGLFDYISFLYRMQSGSMRLMFIPQEIEASSYPDVFLRPFKLDQYPDVQTTYFREVNADTWPEVNSSLPAVRFFEIQEGALEVDIPFYQPYPVQMSNLGRPKAADAFSEGFDQPYNYGTEIAINNGSIFDVYRSIGEDFSFGYLVGPPLAIYVP